MNEKRIEKELRNLTPDLFPSPHAVGRRHDQTTSAKCSPQVRKRVHGIDLTVDAGETVAYAGPNGGEVQASAGQPSCLTSAAPSEPAARNRPATEIVRGDRTGASMKAVI
jgi:hypothetical protein